MSGDGAAPGFYGKLPALGDFVGRRLARDFVAPWDEWLQRCMAGSRTLLGGGWLDAYLGSPLWRFALPAGVCGPRAASGVMMPSVDRVGRYFPLAVVAPLPPGTDLVSLTVDGVAWYRTVEALLINTLDDDGGFTIEDFDARVQALGMPPLSAVTPVPGPLRLPLRDADDLHAVMLSLAAALALDAAPRALWWSAGGERVAPLLLLSEGLPAAEDFAAMLDGVFDGERAPPSPAAEPRRPAAAVVPAAPLPPAAAGSAVAPPAIEDAGLPEDETPFADRPVGAAWRPQDEPGGAARGMPLIEDAGLPEDDALEDEESFFDADADADADADPPERRR